MAKREDEGGTTINYHRQLARHMGGLDENNAKDMGELIRTADKLRDDYKCAIMLVHHTGHAHQDRARGSTAFKGALDTEIIVNQLGIMI